ncbi:ferritin-like domain-containing protein [Rasiella sp. SM2506]|uniref:ferritin-like domain-containing protein n=1 Tax=Rasiella sp. SM2506 TaxID=3423914 RepID=UPI003D7AD758
MKTKEEISKKINALIEKNNDAYKGFKNAAENAESSQLKSYLLQQSSERKSFATTLSSSLHAYNPDFKIDTDGSVTGSIHRSWMDFKSALSMDDDESILEECIRGDKASVEEYKEFLQKYPSTSDDIKRTIEGQLQNVKNTLNSVERLEDLH